MKKSELKELYQMMFPDYPDIVTVKQLREMIGVSRALAYKLITDGEIQAVQIGTSLKIPKASVINYVTGAQKEVKFRVPASGTDPVPAQAVQPTD